MYYIVVLKKLKATCFKEGINALEAHRKANQYFERSKLSYTNRTERLLREKEANISARNYQRAEIEERSKNFVDNEFRYFVI